MRVCLDARVTTRGGTSTFIEGFVQQIGATTHQHDIDVVAHADQGIASDPGIAVPTGRVRELLWSQISLPRVIKQGQYDIYHSLKHVGPLTCSARTVYRVPAVGQFNGTYPLSRANQFYWGTLGGHAYRNADLLIAVSEYIRQGLLELLGLPEDRVVTVHNGVDPRYAKRLACDSDRRVLEDLGLDGRFFLCVGNLGRVKNFETAIRAFQQLDAADDDLQLVIAGGGRGDHAEELRKLAASGDSPSRIRFVGFQSHEALTTLYNHAVALVHPSLHEGFSLTILEAMACGLPIVASRRTSIPEAAGDAAAYAESATHAESFAELMATLLGDEDLRSRLSANAVARAATFTWQACAQKTLDAYDRVAA